MDGFPHGDRRNEPPGDRSWDRPRYNQNNEQYPPFNPYHPHSPPPRNQPSHSRYQREDGFQEDQGYRNNLEEQRRQQEHQERERLRLQEEQRRQNDEGRYQKIKPDFKAMRAQIANAQNQCSALVPSFDKYLEARKVILAPVYENFEENNRKLQDFYFEAQDELIRFKTYVSLFEGAAKSLLFMIHHGLITRKKVDKHLSKSGVDIPVQRGVHGVLIGQMDTLLDECRKAIDRLMRSWAEERAKPKLTEIHEGDVVIELADDEDSEVIVKQKAVVVDDEVTELRKEVSGMKIAMNEMKADMQEMKELLRLAVQQASIKDTRVEVHDEAPNPDLVLSQRRNEENSPRYEPVVSRNSGNARESEPQRYRDRSLEGDYHDRNFASSRNYRSPSRSSQSRSDWSPDRYASGHYDRGSRNEYRGYDSERYGREQSYEGNDSYSGHNQSRHDRNRHSRDSSRDRQGYRKQNQSLFHGFDEDDMIGVNPHASNESAPQKNRNSGPSKNQGSREHTKGDDICWYCKKPGHHRNQCKEIRCNSCGRLGHVAASCTTANQTGHNS